MPPTPGSIAEFQRFSTDEISIAEIEQGIGLEARARQQREQKATLEEMGHHRFNRNRGMGPRRGSTAPPPAWFSKPVRMIFRTAFTGRLSSLAASGASLFV
jgi:hypothetical protein